MARAVIASAACVGYVVLRTWNQAGVLPDLKIYWEYITINVVDRTAKAINYQHRSGATKIDFRGTPLLPDSHGQAKVESKQGYIEIEVEFRKLQPATRFAGVHAR